MCEISIYLVVKNNAKVKVGIIIMRPIALVTCYYHHNYGSMLQAYATQMMMEQLKLPYETLACKTPMVYMLQNKFLYYIKKIIIADWNLKLGKIKINYQKMMHKETFGKKINIRNEYFDDFANTCFKISPYYPTRLELSKAVSKYSAFLVGSDQLWRTDSVEAGYFTLDFVPDDILKVAYSTSFGIKEVPWFQIKKNKKFLNRFDFISVREKSAANLIKELINRDVPVVLDPTLLFTGDQWMHLQEKKPIIESGYIFCYFLGNNPWQREFVLRLKKRTGLKIVALLHLDNYIPRDERFADVSPYNIGPNEFLNLMRNANYVFTDSFHGTVFSILYEKNFFTFNRFKESNIQSTNTRIDNLLEITGMENRRIMKDTSIEYCLGLPVDFCGVDGKIEFLRKFSFDFLEKAFSALIQ
jgi:hypothetical protein